MPHLSMEIECANAHKVEIQLDIFEPETQKFAVLLPGKGYRVTDPIFYFIYQLLEQLEFNIVNVDYGYDRSQEFEQASLDDKLHILLQDAKTIGKTLKTLIEPGELVLVGKSLGTIIMSQLISDPALAADKLAWLTPSTGLECVDKGIQNNAERSFVCIGTKDPGFKKEQLAAYAHGGAANCIIDGVAHVLEAKDDVPKTIMAHHQMIAELSAWLNARA